MNFLTVAFLWRFVTERGGPSDNAGGAGFRYRTGHDRPERGFVWFSSVPASKFRYNRSTVICTTGYCHIHSTSHRPGYSTLFNVPYRQHY
jgi:hypothetical protein